MLSHLSIRDIVLIERLDIEFRSGLSVLTGETGAGKSILLDSLSLALGARGDASLVRHGADQGQVTAVFDVSGSHPARLFLRDNGFDDDGDIILRRLQMGMGVRAFSSTIRRQVSRFCVIWGASWWKFTASMMTGR